MNLMNAVSDLLNGLIMRKAVRIKMDIPAKFAVVYLRVLLVVFSLRLRRHVGRRKRIIPIFCSFCSSTSIGTGHYTIHCALGHKKLLA